ncbi:MAG: DUF2189 domain-containing protein [Sulfitobacter sp.]|nr:DUF2189 domain-containing protein [Sulfitobacter sp.]
MHTQTAIAPRPRPLTFADIGASLRAGLADFAAQPLIDIFYALPFVLAGLFMGWITYVTGTTFWLVLAVLGFPLIGTLAALGFYEVSRRRQSGEAIRFAEVARHVWHHKNGQLPWLATIIVVVFLFWFFLGHMIFALFLGLAPMTNISSSLGVFLTTDGLMMLAFGSLVGAIFSLLVFSVSVLGIPMLMDRDVDFVTALIRSIAAVSESPLPYLVWGLVVALITLVAMLPGFLGLFLAMPVLGHATWHLYSRVTEPTPVDIPAGVATPT